MLGDRVVIGWATRSYAKQKISQNIFTYFHSASECHFMDLRKTKLSNCIFFQVLTRTTLYTALEGLPPLVPQMVPLFLTKTLVHSKNLKKPSAITDPSTTNATFYYYNFEYRYHYMSIEKALSPFYHKNIFDRK